MALYLLEAVGKGTTMNHPSALVRHVTVIATACTLTLLAGILFAPAEAQVLEQVQVNSNGGNPTDPFPDDLFVQVTSPSEYQRGCCLDSNSGEWVGPEYESEQGGLGSTCTMDWGVTFDADATSAEDAARAKLGHGWSEIESGAVQIPHYQDGEIVEEITGFFILTHELAEDFAYYEASVSFPLGRGVYATAEFVTLSPSSDEAGGSYGAYKVKGTETPSEWNYEQIHIAMDTVALAGSLPKYGTNESDDYTGTGSDDSFFLGGGDDRANGMEGDDTLSGQAGNDTLIGGADNDKVKGGAGDDRLYGDSGPEGEATPGRANLAAAQEPIVYAGNDVLSGGGGNDRLDGGPRTDVLKGGPGIDTCIFDSKKELKRATSCEKKKRNF